MLRDFKTEVWLGIIKVGPVISTKQGEMMAKLIKAKKFMELSLLIFPKEKAMNMNKVNSKIHGVKFQGAHEYSASPDVDRLWATAIRMKFYAREVTVNKYD